MVLAILIQCSRDVIFPGITARSKDWFCFLHLLGRELGLWTILSDLISV